MTNGTLTVVGSADIGSDGGSGTFYQSGGSVTVNNFLRVGAAGSNGSVTVVGGTFTAHATVNQGLINQTGGVTYLGPVTGTNGNLTVGYILGADVPMHVTSFQQAQVTARTTGQLLVASNAARFTNTATSLNIQGNGLIDLANNDLLTTTSASTIRGYLINAYTLNNDWSGHGINSIFASTNPTKYTVGYANGNDQSSQDARPDVPAGKVLVVPTLVGDANLDHTVDFFDIAQLLGYKYNTGQPASYTDGDLNYDGVVDFFDLSVILSANYNSGEVFGSPAVAAEPALATTPEPAGAVILALGGAAAVLVRQRRRRREKHERPR
jgi:hypothetical protein